MINYTEEEILSMLKDEQKTDEFLSTLTGEDVKRLLLYVNSRVRNIPIEENKFCEETMCAGGLVSPDNEIQNRYFEKIAEALKNVKGKKDRATMMFYLINELHLFEDGNGRTSRAIFEMFTNKDFSFENNDTLTHTYSNGNEHAIVDHNDFQRNNSIEGSCYAEQCSNCFLYKSLMKSGIIPDIDFYKKKILINTDADELLEHNMNEGINEDNNPVFVPEEVKRQLSYIQFKQIQNSLADNNGSLVTTSGMALLLMAQNGIMGDLTEYEYANGDALTFTVDRESGTGEEHLSKFKKEDYFKTIGIASILKEGMLDMILDFFEQSNNFRFNDTATIRDILTSGNIKETTLDVLKLQENPKLLDDYEISRAISQGGIINIAGTRTEKTMQLLAKYIEQNISRNDNIVEVSDISKQVISEISDPAIEDEAERQEHIDMQKMLNKDTQEK